MTKRSSQPEPGGATDAASATDPSDEAAVGADPDQDQAESEPRPEAPTGEADHDDESPERAEEEAAEAELRDEAERVHSEMAALHDRHLRLAAEFDNYRKRAQTEMTEAWVRAQADLVRGLLEPLDDMKRVSALDLSNATVEGIMEGIDLVERKVMRALEEAGLREIDPTGEPFDPNTMEAMMRIPADSPDEDEIVHEVFQKGYTLKGHLVRPARVSVLKHG